MTYWAAWRAVAVVILMVASGACASTQEAGKPGVVAVDVTEFTSTVEAVDYQKRTIALRGAQGNVRAYKVGDSVQRLNDVKTGDQVVLRVTDALAILVEKP